MPPNVDPKFALRNRSFADLPQFFPIVTYERYAPIVCAKEIKLLCRELRNASIGLAEENVEDVRA